MSPWRAHVSAIVLCGGGSSRMGGKDKTAARLGRATVLDHLLDSLSPDWTVTCVGQRRTTRRDVAWVQESPPGGGPVAGIAAALSSAHPGTPSAVVVVLAGDLPFAGPAVGALTARLVALPREIDGIVARDGNGRTQPLLAAYRQLALTRALPEHAAGASVRSVVARLHLRALDVAAPACLDVDTPEALAEARGILAD